MRTVRSLRSPPPVRSLRSARLATTATAEAGRPLVEAAHALCAPAWHADALCSEYPAEWWFPTREYHTPRRPQDVCERCLVRECCEDAGLEDPNSAGVWVVGRRACGRRSGDTRRPDARLVGMTDWRTMSTEKAEHVSQTITGPNSLREPKAVPAGDVHAYDPETATTACGTPIVTSGAALHVLWPERKFASVGGRKCPTCVERTGS